MIFISEESVKWHYSTLQKFREGYFAGIVPPAALDEEMCIKGQPFWSFKIGKKRYLIDINTSEDFPIKIRKTTQLQYRNKILNVVNEYDKVRIKAEKYINFRSIVDDLANFKHTNPEHFKILRLIALAGYIDRVNVRFSSEAGFGKDSIYSVLGHLGGDIAVINPKTEAAVEYRLTNKMLVLDELSNLNADRKDLLQELLLQIGDMRNIYQKSSRGDGKMTFDEYDVSKLSVSILFNNYDYYAGKGQSNKFFDKVFTKAVLDRFIPFRLNGVLEMTQFKCDADYKSVAQENTVHIVQTLKSLLWYRENYHTELHGWDKTTHLMQVNGRHQICLHTILNIVDLYSKSKEEFDEIAQEMLKCYREYHNKNAGAADLDIVEEVVI